MSKSSFFSNFHLIRSPLSVEGVLDSKIWRKSTTKPNSQSFRSCVKRTSQLLISHTLCLAKDKSIEAPLFVAILYNTGKVNWRGWSPHHLSCQNFTLFLTPISNWVFLLKASQPKQIPFHKLHPWTPLTSLKVHPPYSSPNFKVTTLLQTQVPSTLKRHNHFPSKTLLKVVSFLIPNPPLAIRVHTLYYPTKCCKVVIYNYVFCWLYSVPNLIVISFNLLYPVFIMGFNCKGCVIVRECEDLSYFRG